MFDTVRCRFPLPHHQDVEFQTKDLEHVAFGEGGEGTMSLYEITEDGRLRRRAHRYRIARKPPAFRRVVLKSTKTWWEDVPDAHGDVYIYTFERSSDGKGLSRNQVPRAVHEWSCSRYSAGHIRADSIRGRSRRFRGPYDRTREVEVVYRANTCSSRTR